MVAKSREYWDARKGFHHLRHGLLKYHQVLLPSLVPHIVRGQVSGPQDVVNVLEGKTKNV